MHLQTDLPRQIFQLQPATREAQPHHRRAARLRFALSFPCNFDENRRQSTEFDASLHSVLSISRALSVSPPSKGLFL
jgi:hypothetical protein